MTGIVNNKDYPSRAKASKFSLPKRSGEIEQVTNSNDYGNGKGGSKFKLPASKAEYNRVENTKDYPGKKGNTAATYLVPGGSGSAGPDIMRMPKAK